MNGKKAKVMGIFSSSKKEIVNKPQDMSPLESVTHLFAAIQIADQHASHEEKDSWVNAISKLFPEHSPERSEKYFSQAHKKLSLQNQEVRLRYVQATLTRLKTLLTENQINSIGPMIADIVEADGIVMTSELDIVSIAEKVLDIKIVIAE